ncbi:MAG: antibiotic biosynthesis monooxygenase [Bacteroidia bacterium]|jgi:quinol monooxygenase YgiN|nr:antibiotic biosynthesis monooxygenase [Bacteroidia bacterium]
MLVISGYWHVNPARQQEFIALCKWIAPYSKQEEGYISYLFTRDELNENHFLFFEEWKDQAAIDFHVAQWYFNEFMEKTKPMLLSPSVIKIYTVTDTKVL